MPRITQDPNLAESPDFDSIEFQAVYAPLATEANPVENIIGTLKAAWTHNNNAKKAAWEAQVEQDKAAEEATEQERQAAVEAEEAMKEKELQETEEANQREKEKRKPKVQNFTVNKVVDSVSDTCPSPYAIHKLRQGEYIELYYFTPEACSEAERAEQTAAKDNITFTSVGDQLFMKPAAAYKAAKKVIRDEDLTFKQLTLAKNDMLRHMGQEEWPEQHVVALSVFFFKLESHRLRKQDGGDTVVLRYQSQVCREWMEALKGTSDEDVFDISVINDLRLNQMYTEHLNARHSQGVLCIRKTTLSPRELWSSLGFLGGSRDAEMPGSLKSYSACLRCL
ncbi:unnamed protein product [Cyclocybe aegerita]|uniref:Uncharacterized protein n=1 Tax=Cyclocybe aegerita TaxID=1973307 RepID=A0A8S0VV28_CYCAE|nr:unnamed protein product [Cyclocybe aegerita]